MGSLVKRLCRWRGGWNEPLGKGGRDPVICSQWMVAGSKMLGSRHASHGTDRFMEAKLYSDRYYAITPKFLTIVATWLGISRGKLSSMLGVGKRPIQHNPWCTNIYNHGMKSQRVRMAVYWATRVMVAEGVLPKEVADLGRVFRRHKSVRSGDDPEKMLRSWQRMVRPPWA